RAVARDTRDRRGGGWPASRRSRHRQGARRDALARAGGRLGARGRRRGRRFLLRRPRPGGGRAQENPSLEETRQRRLIVKPVAARTAPLRAKRATSPFANVAGSVPLRTTSPYFASIFVPRTPRVTWRVPSAPTSTGAARNDSAPLSSRRTRATRGFGPA